MSEEKQVKTFAQIENEAAEQLNTFVFIIFVPNPNTRGVRMWIDGGEIETYMNTDRFLDIIEKTCGNNVRNRIETACHEFGIPYLFDRSQNKLKELTELPNIKRMELSPDYHKAYEQETSNPYSVENLFRCTQKATQNIHKYGLPDFSAKNIRF